MDYKPLSPWYGWIRGRELEGTLDQGPEVGVWGITVKRVAKGWGIPNDEDYPFDASDKWPPSVVEGADELAKPNRIWCYQQVRSPVEACAAIDRAHAISASFDITDQWFTAQDGIIEYPVAGQFVGGHAVCILDYSRKNDKFRFMNSWGSNWGHGGDGLLSFNFFHDYMTESWSSYLDDRPSRAYTNRINFVRYGYKGFFNTVIHICEVYSHVDDESLGWAFAVQREGFLDIEELYVKPAFRGKGLGSELCRMLNEVRGQISLPFRAWITPADSGAANLPIIDTILRKLGLQRRASSYRWASYVGVGPGDILPNGPVSAAETQRPKCFRFVGVGGVGESGVSSLFL